MSKKLLRVICTTLVSVMAISLVACSGNKNTSTTTTASSATDGKVKLKIYAQYSDEDTKAPYDYAVAALKNEMPNVELELDVQAQDDGQKIKDICCNRKYA